MKSVIVAAVASMCVFSGVVFADEPAPAVQPVVGAMMTEEECKMQIAHCGTDTACVEKLAVHGCKPAEQK